MQAKATDAFPISRTTRPWILASAGTTMDQIALRWAAYCLYRATTPILNSRKQETTYGSDMSDIQEPANLADMVRARAKSRGNAIAYEFEGRQTSFAEFDILTNRVANALKAQGVKPRERIAYLGKNSDVYFELLMGAMKANVVMAPVNWRLAGPEIAFIVEDCKASVLFVGPEFTGLIDKIRPQLPGVRTFIATEGAAPGFLNYT